MEEMEAQMESQLESIEEQIRHSTHEHAEHGAERLKEQESWISQVALGAAIFSVLAAVSALLSNHHSNEAMIEQIQASDLWGYYQAKGIKAGMLTTKIELLTSLGKKTRPEEVKKLGTYRTEQAEIAEKAKEKEASSGTHLKHHLVLARGVTLFQIAISVAAISALTKRRRFWYLGIGFATVGLGFLTQGLLLIR